jgi:hypothetical protein
MTLDTVLFQSLMVLEEAYEPTKLASRKLNGELS